MSVLMQKLGALARVFEAGAANKSKACTRGDAAKALDARRSGTSKKWVIAGLR